MTLETGKKLLKQRNKGFTLIELIFVTVLIALVTTIAIPRITSTLGLSIRTNVLEVAGFLQTSYSHAILTHKKIRVTLDLDKGEYWAEDLADLQSIPLISESTNLDEILNTFRKRSEEDPSDDEKKKKDAQEFKKIDSASLHPGNLDGSLKFKSVRYTGKDQTIKEGTTSFFISASGVNDEVLINIAYSDDTSYTIIFPPIGGKPTVEKGEIEKEK